MRIQGKIAGLIALLSALLVLSACTPAWRVAAKDARVSYAGLRVSSYGIDPFPEPATWDQYVQYMEKQYPGSVGSFVLVIGTLKGQGRNSTCSLAFPLDAPIPGAMGQKVDRYASFLEMCDQKGYAVWLQVEPGEANVADVAEVVLRRYGGHRSVRGFGIDVEWYKPWRTNGFGSPFDDAQAKSLEERVKAVDARFTLFLKHWDIDWLPPTYRSSILFISDSQFHESLDTMHSEFVAWAAHFYPNPVMFQIGYESDQDLWGTYTDPTRELGEMIARDLPKEQVTGLFWVDFTARQVMQAAGIAVPAKGDN